MPVRQTARSVRCEIVLAGAVALNIPCAHGPVLRRSPESESRRLRVILPPDELIGLKVTFGIICGMVHLEAEEIVHQSLFSFLEHKYSFLDLNSKIIMIDLENLTPKITRYEISEFLVDKKNVEKDAPWMGLFFILDCIGA